MGLVEQSQVVASTAVIVAMGTIVSAYLVTGQPLGTLGLLSVVTVGVLGYASVFFSLKYGRMLEAQRRELLELNTIAEAVNHSVELDYVLASALEKLMELLTADCGWIYLNENHALVRKHRNGTAAELFGPGASVNNEHLSWIRATAMLSSFDEEFQASVSEQVKKERIDIFASIPLLRQGTFAGVLIIGSKDARKFQVKKTALLQAFGNQVSAALNNASLYEQVRKSERLYADLYENSPDMYHSVDARGIVVSCNATECEMLGFEKDAIVGKPLLNIYPVTEHAKVIDNLKLIFEGGKELKGIEEQVLRRDGTRVDVSLSTSIVQDSEGRPVIARMVLRDITEKKRMEEKILQVQKIDSIGNLAGGIAHDFNNILTAILGSASIMKRKIKNDPRSLKYVDLIETTSRRGAAITRQLLTFARKSSPHVHLIDVTVIVEQTLELFKATIPKSIHVKKVLSTEGVLVNADEGQLQQAILNLCLNARDAMPNGGVLVITTRPVFIDEDHAVQLVAAKPGHYVMISVTDSGIGIPADLQDKIFEPFFTTKEQGKGTGLGLSVVYGVVRSHNGHIHVRSEVDSGTVFTIYLQRVMDPCAEQPVFAGKTQMVGGNERILLIEDEISIGEINADLLLELGYSVAVAQNGREAMQILAEGALEFDLVILDMNMPRMGGRETFTHLKEQYPDLRVLICSGYSSTLIDDGKFMEVINGFLQKPYELEEIALKIRTILDQPAKPKLQPS